MSNCYNRRPSQLIGPKLYGHAIVSESRARLIVARVQRGTYNTDMYHGGWKQRNTTHRTAAVCAEIAYVERTAHVVSFQQAKCEVPCSYKT